MGAIFSIDSGRCTGCGACLAACADQNDLDMDISKPYREIRSRESIQTGGVRFTYISMACLHCEDPKCSKACPAGCVTKDAATGLVHLSLTGCTRCRLCAESCPFGAIAFDVQGYPQKCPGCPELVSVGRLPACVKACAEGAIIFKPRGSS